MSPYSLRPVAISQPLGFTAMTTSSDGNAAGDEAMDASSQLSSSTTDNPAEAQGWKPDGPLFDFHPAAGILGWRFGPTSPDRADPTAGCPAAGDEPFWGAGLEA